MTVILTKVRVGVWVISATFYAMLEDSVDVIDENEGWNKGWLIKVFMNQTVAIKTPHFL